jgi:hypothetical protein
MIKDYMTKLANTFKPKAVAERKLKPWQQGKPWCTPYVPMVRVLWDVEARGMAYCLKKHGPLTAR